jgi:hypothetical protein
MATPSEPVGQRGSRGVWVAIIARLLEPLEPLEPGAVGGDRGRWALLGLVNGRQFERQS